MYCDSGIVFGRTVFNSTQISNVTVTASQDEYSDATGIVSFNLYAVLLMSQIVVNNVVSYQWYGTAVVLGNLCNGTFTL